MAGDMVAPERRRGGTMAQQWRWLPSTLIDLPEHPLAPSTRHDVVEIRGVRKRFATRASATARTKSPSGHQLPPRTRRSGLPADDEGGLSPVPPNIRRIPDLRDPVDSPREDPRERQVDVGNSFLASKRHQRQFHLASRPDHRGWKASWGAFLPPEALSSGLQLANPPLPADSVYVPVSSCPP